PRAAGANDRQAIRILQRLLQRIKNRAVVSQHPVDQGPRRVELIILVGSRLRTPTYSDTINSLRAERSGEIRGLVPKNRPPLLLQWGLRRTVHHTDAKHVSRSAGSVLSCRNGLNIQPHLTVLLRSKIHEAPRKIPDLLSAEKLRHWGYRFQLSGRQRGKKVLLGGA